MASPHKTFIDKSCLGFDFPMGALAVSQLIRQRFIEHLRRLYE
jgi:hypothetical protein